MTTRCDAGLWAPLSFQQEELVARLCTAPECAPTLDLAYLFLIEGDIDMGCLAGAVEDLIARHETLRTTLAARSGKVVQHVHARSEPVAVQPATSTDMLRASLRSARLQAHAILSGAPLFRAQIAPLGPELYLSFLVSHFMHDGWSCLVLWRDLSEFYAARRERRAPQLPALRLTYADFADEQMHSRAALLEQAVGYCKDRFPEPSAPIAWPGTRASRAAPTPRSRRARFTLPEPAFESLRDLSRAARTPPFTVLLTASAAAVSRVTGQRRIVTGSNAANREDPRKIDLVGYYTNTRIAFVDDQDGLSLLDVVRDVREQWLTCEERFPNLYISQLLPALGIAELLKINMLDLPGFSVQRCIGPFKGLPEFLGARVTKIPDERDIVHWRDFELTWIPVERGYEAEVWYRAPVEPQTVSAIADAVTSILSSSSNGNLFDRRYR